MPVRCDAPKRTRDDNEKRKATIVLANAS